MDLTYITKLRNEQVKEVAILFDKDGSTLAFLTPGQELMIESWNADTIYSRWNSVIFIEGGEIKLEENPDWPRPEGKWLLTAINVEGRVCERRLIGGREVVLPRGIPRLCALEVDDPMAVYSRMEIREVRETKPSLAFADYNEFVDVLKDVFYDRPESELQELAIELKKLTTDIEDVEHV